MPAWTDIDPNDLLPGEPWTSGKAQAAFENVEALAEGAEDAPKVMPKALASGVLEPFELIGGTFTGLVDLDDFAEVVVLGEVSVASNPTQAIRFSVDNGANWGSNQDLFTGSGSIGGTYSVAINLVTGRVTGAIGPGFSFDEMASAPAGVNGFQLRGFSGRVLAFATAGK